MLKTIKIKDIKSFRLYGRDDDKYIAEIKCELDGFLPETDAEKFIKAKNITIQYTPVENILTDEEREYLAAVIKPFRDRIENISMMTDFASEPFININLVDDSMCFPSLGEGKFKGMTLDYLYTLEELGL